MKRLGSLVFVRHGESVWNVTDKINGRQTRFTGWADIPLSSTGESQARACGVCMANLNLSFDKVYTSLLKRSRKTFEIISKEIPVSSLPDEIVSSWRLNERHYGALVGLSELEAEPIFGHDQVLEWRRSWSSRPPPMNISSFIEKHSFNTIDDSSINWPWQNMLWTKAMTITTPVSEDGIIGNELHSIDEHPYPAIPNTESLEDTARRVLPLWIEEIFPRIVRGETILVVGHSNTIRSMIKHLDGISDDRIRDVTIPSAIPLVYNFFKDLQTKEIRTIGKSSASGMKGRYIVNKDLLELSLAASQNLEMCDYLDHDNGEEFKKYLAKALQKVENKSSKGLNTLNFASNSLTEVIGGGGGGGHAQSSSETIMESGWMTFENVPYNPNIDWELERRNE